MIFNKNRFATRFGCIHWFWTSTEERKDFQRILHVKPGFERQTLRKSENMYWPLSCFGTNTISSKIFTKILVVSDACIRKTTRLVGINIKTSIILHHVKSIFGFYFSQTVFRNPYSLRSFTRTAFDHTIMHGKYVFVFFFLTILFYVQIVLGNRFKIQWHNIDFDSKRPCFWPVVVRTTFYTRMVRECLKKTDRWIVDGFCLFFSVDRLISSVGFIRFFWGGGDTAAAQLSTNLQKTSFQFK